MKARKLAAAIEPFAGQVYFAPECHAGYASLGFSPSPGDRHGVAQPDGQAYFCSRGSILGQAPGELVAAAFAVFNPAVVIPFVAAGWSIADAPAIQRLRTSGATAQLTRILGAAPAGSERLRDILARASRNLPPAGKPLYSGLLGLAVPDTALGAAWRYADMLREFRGDAHTAAWTSAGFDAVEIGLLTELYWGRRLKSYVRTRAWSDAELDAGIARLEDRGLVRDGAFTDLGRREREAVEEHTDAQCRPIMDALGDDYDAVMEILQPMGQRIRADGGYPAAGPHDVPPADRAAS